MVDMSGLLLILFLTIIFTGVIAISNGASRWYVDWQLDYNHPGLPFPTWRIHCRILFWRFIYTFVVINGLHHGLHGIKAVLLADPKVGINFLLPICWSMANVA